MAALLLLAGCASQPLRRNTPYDLSLRTPTGQFFDLGRLEGKVVLLTFFATWCLPCMLEVPVFQALQQDFGERRFEVVAVGMDLEGPRTLAPFEATLQPHYRVLVADDAIREGRSPFGPVVELPTTFLFDRQGREVARYTGTASPEQLHKLIDRMTR